MPQVRLERFALVCAAVAIAACSGKDRTSAADSAAMTPAGGAMSSDTGAMGGAGAAGATGGAMSPTTDSANRAGGTGSTGSTGSTSGTSGTAGTSGAASASGTAGTSGTGTSGGAVPNQTQSGVTNAKTGSSTLGPNIKKVGPTTAADSSHRTTAHP